MKAARQSDGRRESAGSLSTRRENGSFLSCAVICLSCDHALDLFRKNIENGPIDIKLGICWARENEAGESPEDRLQLGAGTSGHAGSC